MTDLPIHDRAPAPEKEIPAPHPSANPPATDAASTIALPDTPAAASIMATTAPDSSAPAAAPPFDRAVDTAAEAPAPGHQSAPRAMALGMLAYVLGIALTVVTSSWALTKVHDRTWEISSAPSGFTTAAYTGWGTHQLIFVGFLLLATFAGWLIAGLGAKLFSGGAARHSHAPGMAAGALVFALGVGLVVLVFLTAANYFGATGTQVPVPAPSGPAPDYIGWALNGILRLILLAVMALNGALTAGRGAQMFLGTLGRV